VTDKFWKSGFWKKTSEGNPAKAREMGRAWNCSRKIGRGETKSKWAGLRN